MKNDITIKLTCTQSGSRTEIEVNCAKIEVVFDLTARTLRSPKSETFPSSRQFGRKRVIF
jgi:hypothetical protein